MDLSPHCSNVNDEIDPQLCSLSYSRLDDAVLRVLSQRCGALLAKLDFQNAYRTHPDDHGLIGIRWHGSMCLDATLPFGLCSAPKIFSEVAVALLWVVYTNGMTLGIRYLEDFLFFGSPDSDE